MAHIDWLTLSLPYRSDFYHALPEHPAFRIEDEHFKIPRYEQAYTLACGAIFAIPAEDNQRQKILFDASGIPMYEARKIGASDPYMLEQLIYKGAKFTRIDVAFDTDDETATPLQTKWSWDKKECKTHLRTEPKVIESPKGDTVYFGDETSERRLRVYDKAKQMDILNQALVRVELQSRNKMANVLARDIVQHGVAPASAAHIKKVIDFPFIKWWQKLIDDGGTQAGQIPRKSESDVMHWLRTQVEPAILKLQKTGSPRERLALIAWHDHIWPNYSSEKIDRLPD